MSVHTYITIIIFPTIVLYLTEKLLEGKNNEYEDIVDLFRIGTAVVIKAPYGEFVPIDKMHIKRIELEADEFAVKHITHGIDSAVRCLKHLCYNDLKRESHIWEISQISYPIMTMNERIEELKKRTTSKSLHF